MRRPPKSSFRVAPVGFLSFLSYRVPALEQTPTPRTESPHAADPDPTTPPAGVGLSWDREDAAIAASQCPWHPNIDFPDTTELVRHIIRHARVWEAEAMQSERQRRNTLVQVSAFAREVRRKAELLGGAS